LSQKSAPGKRKKTFVRLAPDPRHYYNLESAVSRLVLCDLPDGYNHYLFCDLITCKLALLSLVELRGLYHWCQRAFLAYGPFATNTEFIH
jgi:hypothetical protein